jgi:hypothetical protein
MNTNIKTLINKVTNWYTVDRNIDLYVKADYFNGSSNDAENIFIELKKLIQGNHFHHSRYFIQRLNFLINEGIDVASVQTAGFKALAASVVSLAEQPVAETPAPKKVAVKKVTPKKATTKKKVTAKKAVKKAYKLKRDKNGRFIARR